MLLPFRQACLALCCAITLATGLGCQPSADSTQTSSAARTPTTYPVRWIAAVPLATADAAAVRLALNQRVDIHTDAPMVLEKGDDDQSPRTGADYLKLHDAGYVFKTNLDNMKESWFKAAALPIRWISQCRPARVSYVRELVLASRPQEVLALLPAELGVNLTGDQAGRAWLAAWPKSMACRRPGDDGIAIDDGDGGMTELRIIAWGDHNHDGVDDMLVKVDNWTTQGTFKSYRYVTLTGHAGNAALAIIGGEL